MLDLGYGPLVGCLTVAVVDILGAVHMIDAVDSVDTTRCYDSLIRFIDAIRGFDALTRLVEAMH